MHTRDRSLIAIADEYSPFFLTTYEITPNGIKFLASQGMGAGMQNNTLRPINKVSAPEDKYIDTGTMQHFIYMVAKEAPTQPCRIAEVRIGSQYIIHSLT